jgi:diguanylate cyclase (GGDEF)-like protein
MIPWRMPLRLFDPSGAYTQRLRRPAPMARAEAADFVVPRRNELALAGAVAGSLIVAGIGLTPVANVPLYPIPGYMTAFGAFMIVINLLLAAFLFSRGTIDNHANSIRLGATYFFIALVFLPLMATFPSGFVPFQIMGGKTSSVWLWAFWHAGFGIGILRYALSDDRKPCSVRISAAEVILLVIALALVATVGLPYLPSMLADGHRLFTGFGAFVPPAILLLLLVSLIVVATCAERSQERLWIMVGLVAACFDVWLTYRGATRYALGWYVSKCGSLVTSLSMLTAIMYDVTALRHRSLLANARLMQIAHVDGLTGLSNRRRFDEAIDNEWRRAQRNQHEVSLLMVDVDHFKTFNDRYGHIQGDDCLQKVGEILRNAARRPGDCVARYGGEEFALLLPSTGLHGTREVAKQIHARFEALCLPHEGSPFGQVSVSIGHSTMRPAAGCDHVELLTMADQNLYVAKTSGRNQSHG